MSAALGSRETATGEQPTLSSTRKSTPSGYDDFPMICQEPRRKYFYRGFPRGLRIGWPSENDAFVRARGQAKLAWRYCSHPSSRTLPEKDFSESRILLDCEYRMASPFGGQRRSQSCHPFSQAAVSGFHRDLQVRPVVPGTISSGTRSGSGFSRSTPERHDFTQCERQIGPGIVGLKRRVPLSLRSTRFCEGRAALG